MDNDSTAEESGINRKCSWSQHENSGGDTECENKVKKIRLVSAEHHENLQHTGDAATDWGKRSKT